MEFIKKNTLWIALLLLVCVVLMALYIMKNSNNSPEDTNAVNVVQTNITPVQQPTVEGPEIDDSAEGQAAAEQITEEKRLEEERINLDAQIQADFEAVQQGVPILTPEQQVQVQSDNEEYPQAPTPVTDEPAPEAEIPDGEEDSTGETEN